MSAMFGEKEKKENKILFYQPPPEDKRFLMCFPFLNEDPEGNYFHKMQDNVTTCTVRTILPSTFGADVRLTRESKMRLKMMGKLHMGTRCLLQTDILKICGNFLSLFCIFVDRDKPNVAGNDDGRDSKNIFGNYKV